MKKFSVIAVAMTATLALGACSTEEPEEEPTPAQQTTEDAGDDAGATTSGDMASATGDSAGATAGATYSEPACQEFFTEGGPLADRAVEARAAIENGEVVDTIAVSEVTLLKSRIDATAETAPDDISALLLEVNAPFAEVVDTVNEGGEDVVNPESGEITLPEIDTQASEDAQAELETACAG